jgi:hypothetical protein
LKANKARLYLPHREKNERVREVAIIPELARRGKVVLYKANPNASKNVWSFLHRYEMQAF